MYLRKHSAFIMFTLMFSCVYGVNMDEHQKWKVQKHSDGTYYGEDVSKLDPHTPVYMQKIKRFITVKRKIDGMCSGTQYLVEKVWDEPLTASEAQIYYALFIKIYTLQKKQ